MSITLTHLIHIKKTQNGGKVINHFAFIRSVFLERFIFCVGTLTRTIKDGAFNKSDRSCKGHKSFSLWLRQSKNF
ncbi:hypothetical protein [Staphylococcus epidermidis]|uniref:hypothetical protein n=1 Tax=Staphylococcus epidermidis TaxID=1282 RepID=UPI0007E314CA|nr:hypothetical protein [Staphylococcus epidermidis]MCG2135024.1 hypothetical protein [Staphylococcus epidermidis]OAW62161.1 hypothetical protein A7P87_03855 [Staphylococcus epidermidis]PIH06225.1 hypothetical protein CTJ00_13940 [Staphylococcus epidermidis]